MAKGKYQKLFTNYKLQSGHIAVLKAYENTCGFEPIGCDEVTDMKSFRECLQRNLQWLYDLHTDTYKAVNATANERIGGITIFD